MGLDAIGKLFIPASLDIFCLQFFKLLVKVLPGMNDFGYTLFSGILPQHMTAKGPKVFVILLTAFLVVTQKGVAKQRLGSISHVHLHFIFVSLQKFSESPLHL